MFPAFTVSLWLLFVYVYSASFSPWHLHLSSSAGMSTRGGRWFWREKEQWLHHLLERELKHAVLACASLVALDLVQQELQAQSFKLSSQLNWTLNASFYSTLSNIHLTTAPAFNICQGSLLLSARCTDMVSEYGKAEDSSWQRPGHLPGWESLVLLTSDSVLRSYQTFPCQQLP